MARTQHGLPDPLQDLGHCTPSIPYIPPAPTVLEPGDAALSLGHIKAVGWLGGCRKVGQRHAGLVPSVFERLERYIGQPD